MSSAIFIRLLLFSFIVCGGEGNGGLWGYGPELMGMCCGGVCVTGVSEGGYVAGYEGGCVAGCVKGRVWQDL